MNEQLLEALRLVHAGRRALWLAGAMQERRDLSAAHDPFFDGAIHAPIPLRYAAPSREAPTAIRARRMRKDQLPAAHTILPSHSGLQGSSRRPCCHKESAVVCL
jgi:hypothetical protein